MRFIYHHFEGCRRYLYSAIALGIVAIAYLTLQPPHAHTQVVFCLACTGPLICFMLLDMLWDALQPGPTYQDLILRLRSNPYIAMVMHSVAESFTTETPASEKEITESLEEIMAVVNWERWLALEPLRALCLPLFKFLGILLLYTFTAMNLVYYWPGTQVFNGLNLQSNPINYFYATIAAMLLVGSNYGEPIHPAAQFLGVCEIFTGILFLIVIVDFITTTVFQQLGQIRNAVRTYLILR